MTARRTRLRDRKFRIQECREPVVDSILCINLRQYLVVDNGHGWIASVVKGVICVRVDCSRDQLELPLGHSPRAGEYRAWQQSGKEDPRVTHHSAKVTQPPA